MAVHLAYIDCSNLFIEAQKVSAVARGWAYGLAEANQNGQIDFSYRIDFHRLMALLCELEDPVRAVVFGSVTDGNEGLWPHAEAAGFDVRVVERTASGKEKRVDTGVVTRICRDAYLLGQPRRDRITLVAGDGDYEPMVRQLVQDGFEVTLLYWSHASRALQAVASRFYPLDAYLDDLALR
ncbi:NYN domain-containing protein [Pseudoroseomonas wenyumeiae]|uniref:NYN domain-containing protein n=1 Tax=Teichococcus wenyumeiae TaxID=2478470 RepID=A0A3A9JH64_9PROT|nr:NYN domain-containing protein [Pseudoroseomonas wenyumeiae]RKK04681.1 NYN domain-containing protein [Pseudoroseomonas wenyumeiae]RMI17316.1 NYN domain-containing protein [Pseudoroseomonas wenyumeiae]